MEITSVQIQTPAAKDGSEPTSTSLLIIALVDWVTSLRCPNGNQLFKPSKKMPRGERLTLACSLTDEMKNT
jgi:hypothetical protein